MKSLIVAAALGAALAGACVWAARGVRPPAPPAQVGGGFTALPGNYVVCQGRNEVAVFVASPAEIAGNAYKYVAGPFPNLNTANPLDPNSAGGWCLADRRSRERFGQLPLPGPCD